MTILIVGERCKANSCHTNGAPCGYSGCECQCHEHISVLGISMSENQYGALLRLANGNPYWNELSNDSKQHIIRNVIKRELA